jgi:hypothetical protein
VSTDIQIQSQDGQFSDLNHDVVFDTLGRLVMLTGENKLIQDVLKILFTDVNYFYTDYGTQLEELIGTNLGIDQTISILAQRVADSLAYLQFLQTQQASYQQVSSDEIIQEVVTLNVNYLFEITNNDSDSRTFTVQIILLNGTGQTVTVGRQINIV